MSECKECKQLKHDNERLRAEVQTWVNHTKTAVWSDSEECRLLAADNERLRAALRPFADVARDWPDADPDVECGVGAMFVADGKAKIYFRDFHAARAALKEDGDA